MTALDRVLLLLTGLVAIYALWRLAVRCRRQARAADVLYMTAFGVLLVAGLLLIFFTYDALQSPLVVIVAVLIPAGLAAGLVQEILPAWGRRALALAAIGLLAVAITRLTGPAWLATLALIIVHSAAGLTIFGLPIWAVVRAGAPRGFLGITVGGALIGLGGIALAFLKTGSQLLFFSAELVFAILAPLLLLTALAFTFGLTSRPGVTA